MKSKLFNNRATGLLIITSIYILIAIGQVFLFLALKPHFSSWLNLLIIDAAATIAVFIFSLIFSNSSVYDPYWSVEPIVLVGILLFANTTRDLQIIDFVMISLILIWGIRLTLNWIKTFSNLSHQDWRYQILKEKSGLFYPVINFLGIHFFPTMIVFACMLPIIFIFNSNGTIFYPILILGALISLVGIYLEIKSDIDMHKFKRIRKDSSEIINLGLWKYSRHPNYLGEILFWWGIYVLVLSIDINLWWTGIGALANTLMFLFISIPMEENHLKEYKTNYIKYLKTTSMIVPLPKKKSLEENANKSN
jgi:steroid 5-alpha reductase family enzyme